MGVGVVGDAGANLTADTALALNVIHGLLISDGIVVSRSIIASKVWITLPRTKIEESLIMVSRKSPRSEGVTKLIIADPETSSLIHSSRSKHECLPTNELYNSSAVIVEINFSKIGDAARLSIPDRESEEAVGKFEDLEALPRFDCSCPPDEAIADSNGFPKLKFAKKVGGTSVDGRPASPGEARTALVEADSIPD